MYLTGEGITLGITKYDNDVFTDKSNNQTFAHHIKLHDSFQVHTSSGLISGKYDSILLLLHLSALGGCCICKSDKNFSPSLFAT